MFKNDPVLFMNKSITSGVKKFPKDETNPLRSFSTSYYTKLVNNKSEHQSWIIYSPAINSIYCWTSKLFGLLELKKIILSLQVAIYGVYLNVVVYMTEFICIKLVKITWKVY
jgi:hypothetical protein